MSTDLLRTPARPRDTIGFGTEFRFYLLCIYFLFAAETPDDDGQFYLKISILVVMHGQTRDGPLITERGTDGTNRDILYEPKVCIALAKIVYPLANKNFENPIILSNVPSSRYFYFIFVFPLVNTTHGQILHCLRSVRTSHRRTRFRIDPSLTDRDYR